MFIQRDITQQLLKHSALVQIVLGPRQTGKSTLLTSLQPHGQEVTFDDLPMRQLANRDPALFLSQFALPLLLDEVQYVPNLFPEIKKHVDQIKKEAVFGHASPLLEVLYRLTGSNQILMDKNIKESLAGRASYYYLNTLTVHEILKALPEINIRDILFKGGWPELHTDHRLSPVDYLNDYIRSYVEKDIVLSAGIQKVSAFHTVLGLTAARTGQLLDLSGIASDSGITSVTVKEWLGLLERADLIYYLKPYFSNLNTRLVKTPKLYFLDTGLAARLQGWQDVFPLFNSMQIGPLFETLVFSEIIKFIRNYQKSWELFFWRTRDGEEIDFIIKINNGVFHAFEVKLAIQNLPKAIAYPPAYQKQFSPKKPLTIVTFGGESLQLSSQCQIMPIARLHDYLCTLDNL